MIVTGDTDPKGIQFFIMITLKLDENQICLRLIQTS